MTKLLMLAEDPKIYHQAMEDFRDTQEDQGIFCQDHLFEDKYIISEKNFKQ